MVIRITWGRLRAGAWSEFERAYRAWSRTSLRKGPRLPEWDVAQKPP